MFKILLVVLIEVVLIHGISKCCGGDNLLTSTSGCLDGGPLYVGHCNTSYLIWTDDNSTTTALDSSDNLIVDGGTEFEDIVPEHDYCLTNLRDKDVYIICYNETDVDNLGVMSSVNVILQLISVVFIILTVAVYLTIPPLLDLQGINIIHSITGLAFGFVVIAAINYSSYLTISVCHLVAYLLYISFMYAFFWLNIISFHIWRQVVNPKILARFKSWKLIYYCYGIGGPLLMLIFVASVHHTDSPHLKHIHPGIAENKCWFNTMKATLIYFYGPIAILLTCNIVFFTWTALALWKQAVTRRNTKVLKYKVRLYVKLFFVMGLSWIFEAAQGFTANKDEVWFWKVMDVVNSLEGVIIFLVLVVFRKKVIRHLSEKKIFAKLKFTKKWQQVHDSECEEIEDEEEKIDLPVQYLNKKEIIIAD